MCLIHDTKCCTKNNYCSFKDWHRKLFKLLDNEDLSLELLDANWLKLAKECEK